MRSRKCCQINEIILSFIFCTVEFIQNIFFLSYTFGFIHILFICCFLYLRNAKQLNLENESGTSWYAWLRKLAITHFGWDIYLPFVAYTHLLHSDDPSFNEVAETDSQGCTSTAAVILLAIDGSSCVMCSDDASGRREPSLPPPAPLL